MCWEGDTGEDEETLHHLRKCACQTRLGLETPPSLMPGLFQNLYQKNSPQTTRLSSNAGSVFFAGVFELFYSPCITLPGDLPIGPDNPCIVCEPRV